MIENGVMNGAVSNRFHAHSMHFTWKRQNNTQINRIGWMNLLRWFEDIDRCVNANWIEPQSGNICECVDVSIDAIARCCSIDSFFVRHRRRRRRLRRCRLFFFMIFFIGTHTLFPSTHVNGALATFWRPVLSISWIIARPQLKFISLGFHRFSNYYNYYNEYGQ